ncbi:unnamed protein product [Prunus armeniaca]
MQWTIDLVGPMLTALAKKEMMIVVIDYFTKWIKAEALSFTKVANVERFIWKNIICRFNCPQSIVTDNGTQFVGRQITAFLEKYGIKQPFFEHYVPDICSQATSLTSTEGKLLLEYKPHGVFSSVMSSTYAHRRQALSPLQTSYSLSTNSMKPFFEHYVLGIYS